jgi:2-amino-4-hydroxy-6-hydroxymethyldihydropteridine diphosphokinase
MPNSKISLIAIGSNIGKRDLNLTEAINLIRNHHLINVLLISEYIETYPMEYIDQPFFLNCVIKIKTTLSPIELLDFLQSIETKLGRVYRFSKGPREIDLDILTYSLDAIQTDRLIIPHPSFYSRNYIKLLLVSMNELDIITYFEEVARVNNHSNLS